jgi:hypothetical protein
MDQSLGCFEVGHGLVMIASAKVQLPFTVGGEAHVCQ